MRSDHAFSRTRILMHLVILIGLLMLPLHVSLALDIGDGSTRLVIDEKTGKTAYYRFSDRNSLGYDALLDTSDVSFPFATLFLDSKFYKLGESPEFKTFLQRSPNQVSILYRSVSFLVRQQVSLISSAGSGSVDAFRITFEIENSGPSTTIAGLRLLLDTVLGEKTGNHFMVSGLGVITQELRYGLESGARSILSPGEAVSLGIETWGGDLTPPSRTVLASKLKLAQSAWMPAPADAPSTSVSLMPDSAVGLFWEPEGLAPGSLKRISIILRILPGYASGPIVPGGTIIPQTPVPLAPVGIALTQGNIKQPITSEPAKQSQASPGPSETQRISGQVSIPSIPDSGKSGGSSGTVSGSLSEAELKAAMDELWLIVGSLDAAIANPASATPEKIEYWKRRIDFLGARINSR